MSEFLAWKADPSRYFGVSDPTFEKLRKPLPKNAPYELVETSYFGFSIPEEKIHCEIYHWAHPKFGVTSGGIMIFQGNKRYQWEGDFIEYRNYQPLPDDITDCTYADGVTVRMIKPMEEFEIHFEDAATSTSVHFTSKAIMPPAFRPTGGHITQALKTTGTLVLHGRSYKIDNYFTRDRSWGDPRLETRLDIPPIGWHVGVFGDDLAFHVTNFESADMNPLIARRYPAMANGQNHIWGYLWKAGNVLGIKSSSKVIHREAGSLVPTHVQLRIIDENDERYDIEGSIVARLPMSVWPNMTFFFALTQWTLKGESRVGWGDTQDAMFDQFLRESSAHGALSSK
ncbi:MAG: hypothetical protein ABW034_12270 [Steroidobacteraceae bacterium]